MTRRVPEHVVRDAAPQVETQRRELARRDREWWLHAPTEPHVDPELTEAEREELDRVFGAEHRRWLLGDVEDECDVDTSPEDEGDEDDVDA